MTEVERLQQELEVAKLKLRVAELEAEVQRLKEQPHWWYVPFYPCWQPWPPPKQPEYVITYGSSASDGITSSETGVAGGAYKAAE